MTSLLPTLIKASAGSGKTQKITDRYLHLIFGGESPDKILATTFTRKAAGEIRNRILKRILDATISDEGAQKLNKELGLNRLDADSALKALAKLSRESHRLRIQTLDAFCIQIARSFCFEIGLEPSWKIAESRSIKDLYEEVVSRISLQLGAVELANKVNLISKGDANRSIHEVMLQQLPALRPFIRESTPEIWNWIKASYPSEQSQKNIVENLSNLVIPRTQKGEPDKNWKKSIDSLIEDGARRRWDAVLSNSLVQKYLAKEPYNRKAIDPPNSDIIGKVTELIADIESVNAAKKLVAAYELGKLFNQTATELEHEKSILDFQGVKSALSSRAILGDLHELYFRLDSTIGHILLDEFQDTSIAEWNVIEPVIAEILSKEPGDHSFFCVGDSKQAIYGWRGGVSAIFDSITNNFSSVNPIDSSTSFRSTKEIIKFVNLVFNSLPRSSELADYPSVLALWQDRFKNHEVDSRAPSYNLPGHVSVTVVPRDRPTKMAGIAGEIKRLLQERLSDDIAILVRSNRQVGEYVECLSAEGINVQEEGGQPLLGSAAVSVVIALLRLLDHPGDRAAAYLVDKAPLGSILPLGRQSFTTLRERFAKEGFGNVVNQIAEHLSKYYPEREAPFLKALASNAFAYQEEIGSRLSSFENYIEDSRVNLGSAAAVKVMTIHQSKGLEFDTVFLPELEDYIVHGSRLPWVVPDRENAISQTTRMVPALNKSYRPLLPEFKDALNRYESTLVDESLCLLYVAMTRAKRGLHLVYDWKRNSESLTYGNMLASIFENKNSDAERTPVLEATKIFEDGAEKPTITQAKPRVIEEILVPNIVKFSKPSKRRQPTFESPSEAKSEEHVLLNDIFKPREYGAISKGIEIHKILEGINWIDSAEVSSQMPGSLLDQAFKKEPFARLFAKNSYPSEFEVEVLTELGVLVRDEDKIVHGVCDRVVKLYQDGQLKWVEIIDFKVSAASREELFEKYSHQMNMYRKALSQSYRIDIDNIAAKIVSIPNAEIVEVQPCRF
jgi:ATP-dependent exoDNAse (exonuclease V) beta subunit